MLTDVSVHVNRPEDNRFIAASWFRSQQPVFKAVPWTHYQPGMDSRIRRLLEASLVQTLTFTRVPEEVLAYSVSQGPVLHMLYTKHTYRKQGLAKHLLAPLPCTQYSHLPTNAPARHLLKHLTYNPFALDGAQ